MSRATRSARVYLALPGLIALGLGLSLAIPPSLQAAGGTYEVLLCAAKNRGLGEVALREGRGYQVGRGCGDRARAHALQLNSALAAAARGNEASARWRAPADTGIVAVKAATRTRRHAGHQPRIYLADARGRETARVAAGNTSGFRARRWSGSRQTMLVAALRCRRSPRCRQSNRARTWVRGLRIKLADYADPRVSTVGSLLAEGWRRAVHGVDATAEDEGSGLRGLAVSVNGLPLEQVDGACGGAIAGSAMASRLKPCSGDPLRLVASADTRAAPFRDGQNAVAVCGEDFAGNRGCETRSVMVDNAAPAAGFAASQDPDDPERVEVVVSDQHSGVAGGQIFYRPAGGGLWTPAETVLTGGRLWARIDSTSVPPGVYEFRTVVADAAGNETDTRKRVDGLEKQLVFPLKAGVRLSAWLGGGAARKTVPYGRRGRAVGLLRDASGEPIAGQELVVTERFPQGALIRERETRVRTNSRGRWRTRLPAGPSRTVHVAYEGSPRYLAAETLGGRFRVLTRARLRVSRRRVPEGRSVVFRGRLGRRGARMPAGGKLVELQAREPGGGWQTVGEGKRTSANGRFMTRYRFGSFYERDVRFRFRLKVAREADWPYKAPVRSKARRVTVRDVGP